MSNYLKNAAILAGGRTPLLYEPPPEEHEQRCPVCHQDGGLWVIKGGHWQVWHPTRLFPCGIHTL